jgi:hypothetical protein
MRAWAFIVVSSLTALVPVEAADLRQGKPVASDLSEGGAASPGGSVVPRLTVTGTSLLVLDPGTNEVLSIGRPARTVLVGSPDILEASVINENTIALTAKAAGSTNLIVLGEDGVEFLRRTVQVGHPPEPPPPPPKPIIVYSGGAVQTFLCQPTCNAPPDALPPITSVATTISGVLPSGGGGFPNCDAARAAGPTPLRRGQPGYAPHLDADNDGVACEPPSQR